MTHGTGREIVVGVGDCKVAAFPAICLSTYALGSCIAVVTYDWKSRIGGLLHFMLPDSSIDPDRAKSNPFVYVDTGVPELFRQLQEMGCARKRVRCCIAGGASMMGESAHFEIGKRNYLALKRVLWRNGIFIDREDIGGTESRSVRLDIATGRIDLRTGGARERIFAPAGINLTGRTANDASAGR
jgi:chemotaxis protein CheD